MTPQPERKVFHALTGLRGVTALSVVSLHFGALIIALLPFSKPLVELSRKVVFRMDLFFILSGFVLAYVHVARSENLTFQKYREFLWARFIRIYPGHLVALLVLLAAVALGASFDRPVPGNYPMSAVPMQLTLTQIWPYLNWAYNTWNYPAWFLSSLWFGYLAAFPVAWWLVPRIRDSRFLFCWFLAPILLRLPLSLPQVLPDFSAVLRVSLDLFAGIFLCFLYLKQSRFVTFAQRHLDAIVLVFLALLITITSMAPGMPAYFLSQLLILSCPLLVAGMTAETSFTARLMTCRPLLWCGKISYALFVSHAIPPRLLKAVLPEQDFGAFPLSVRTLILVAHVALIIGLAYAFHKWVELPCLNLLRGSSSRAVRKAAPKKLVPVSAT